MLDSAYKWYHIFVWGLPLWFSWLKICLQCGRCEFDPWVGKIPWRMERLSTPVSWPGEFHGLYSLWGRKESDTTEQLSRLWKELNEIKARMKYQNGYNQTKLISERRQWAFLKGGLSFLPRNWTWVAWMKTRYSSHETTRAERTEANFPGSFLHLKARMSQGGKNYKNRYKVYD